MKFPWLALIAGAALAPVAFTTTARSDDVTGAAVIQHYGDLAAAMYGDALAAAQDLQTAVDAFIAAPSAERWPPRARPGTPRAPGTSRPRASASATRSSMTGKAG